MTTFTEYVFRNTGNEGLANVIGSVEGVARQLPVVGTEIKKVELAYNVARLVLITVGVGVCCYVAYRLVKR